MSTTRAATPRVPWNRRGLLQSLLVGGALGASFLGCSFGWDTLDPRLGGSGGGAATTSGTGGSGPVTSAGGASSGSVTSGAITSSSVSDASSSAGTGGSAAGSSSSGSSSSSTGGGGPAPCGGTSVLADDFPGGDPGELWNLNENGTVLSEAGGEALITLPNNSASGSWGQFDSKHAYDFRGDSISIELTGVTNPQTTAQSWFGTGYDDNNYLQIYQKHGVIHFEYHQGGVKTSLKTTAFDPVAHRHWRLRDDGTTTFWETSSDGASWNVMGQVATAALFPMDVMWVWFGAGTDGGDVNPGVAKFDHVNGGGAPKQKWCPASTMKDDFTDGARSLSWGGGWEDFPGMLAETGGQFTVALVPNKASSASYASSSCFDLTGSSVVVEVPTAVSTVDGSETRIALVGPNDQEMEMTESQGHLHFNARVLSSWQSLGTLLYAPVAHRWWRLRESAGTLYWDTSADGKVWISQAQLSPLPFPIDALGLYLGSSGWASQPSPGTSAFDNLNLPPP